jgi:hypothetical protein
VLITTRSLRADDLFTAIVGCELRFMPGLLR